MFYSLYPRPTANNEIGSLRIPFPLPRIVPLSDLEGDHQPEAKGKTITRMLGVDISLDLSVDRHAEQEANSVGRNLVGH